MLINTLFYNDVDDVDDTEEFYIFHSAVSITETFI